jgi:hypothetical protein
MTSDQELIAASGQDPGAFEPLVGRHGADLHAYLTRRTAPGVADDLLSDVWLAAYSGPTYAYGLPFKVGDRLLVTGDLYAGGPDPEMVGRAWNCQFSRFYDEASAREWRETFGK